MNALDSFMDKGRQQMLKMAADYAKEKHGDADIAKSVQLQTQVLKSNTGKMFERFVGLAIAYALHELDAPYCIIPFSEPFLKRFTGFTRENFAVSVKLGAKSIETHIDADLCAFNPENIGGEFFMVSVKSTLKDRFHNVPFWNLLRARAYANKRCRKYGPRTAIHSCGSNISRSVAISLKNNQTSQPSPGAKHAANGRGLAGRRLRHCTAGQRGGGPRETPWP